MEIKYEIKDDERERERERRERERREQVGRVAASA
jgi:hypothetical protein